MLTLVVGLALAQAPKVVVVETSNLGVPAKRTAELTQLLVELFKTEKVDAVVAKVGCADRTCVVAAAKKLEAAAAVSLAFAALGKDAVMDLESVEVADGNPIAQTTFTVKGADTKLPFEGLAFVADTRRGLPAPAPASVAQADAPKQTTVTPTEPPPAQPAANATASSSSAMTGVRIGLFAAAVAVGVTSLVFLILALSDHQKSQATTEPGGSRSPLMREEANGLVSSANQKYTLSAALGGTTAALAAAAFITFAF
ncbi:MAG: hypothetical protein JNK82_07645 [Myxococcaceae bacterium]|nr:hypothetical protein [Myxococcaceae bacterium]